MKTPSLARFPKLVRQLRPSGAEVDYYARLIMKHEQRPLSALRACQREAEFQLWTMRSLLGQQTDGVEPLELIGA